MALLEAAEERVGLDGFSGARLGDIARHAGLTTGAFYRHFADKDAMGAALAARLDAELAEALEHSADLGSAATAWLDIASARPGGQRAIQDLARPGAALTQNRLAQRNRRAALLADRWPVGGGELASRLLADALEALAYAESRGWSERLDHRAVGGVIARLATGGLYRSEAASRHVPPPPRRRRFTPSIEWAPGAGKVKPTSARGLATWEDIRAAALAVFGRKGLEATNVLEIATETGVASGTVYQYFENKEDIFRSLLSSIEEDMIAEALVGTDVHGRLALRRSASASFAVYRKHASLTRVWVELLRTGTEFEAAWVQMWRNFRDGTAALIERQRRYGMVAAGVSPLLAAEVIVALHRGPMHARVTLGWDGDATDEDVADTIHRLVTGA